MGEAVEMWVLSTIIRNVEPTVIFNKRHPMTPHQMIVDGRQVVGIGRIRDGVDGRGRIFDFDVLSIQGIVLALDDIDVAGLGFVDRGIQALWVERG